VIGLIMARSGYFTNWRLKHGWLKKSLLFDRSGPDSIRPLNKVLLQGR
jgi:hypothetical protein